MALFHGFLLLLSVVAVVVTLLPFLPAAVWWVRVWEFLRIQIAMLALLLVLLLSLLYGLSYMPFNSLDLVVMVSLILCVIYHAAHIFPYTPLAKEQVQTSRHTHAESMLRLLFVNVEMTNRKAERLKQIIHAADADVILAVETDDWWQAQLEGIAATHPHTVWYPQDNYYGMMLFARLDLIDPQIKYLIQESVPSIHTQVRLRNGHMVHLHCLHPRPPVPNDKYGRATERDAELSLLGRQLEGVDVPTVVLGDLNDVAWSHTTRLFARLSGLLDPRVGRGLYNSFHVKYPFLRFPLDHLFHSEHFRLVDFQRLPAFGSDHFPMLVVLNLEPQAKREQNAEPATTDDEVEAEEKIEAAR